MQAYIHLKIIKSQQGTNINRTDQTWRKVKKSGLQIDVECLE